MEQCEKIFDSSYFDSEENVHGLSSEKLLWLVKEEIILLTGGRDKKGCRILSCPSKKETDRYALEDLQLLITYLLGVPSQDELTAGFTVVVDMRRCKWETIKPLLRAFDDSNNGQQIQSALVIRPDNFLQKQKANFGSSKLSFETSVISLEALVKYVDKTQVTIHFEGALNYDHNQWIRLRHNFETFTWQANKFLTKLERVQECMSSVELAKDSKLALVASNQHQRYLQVIHNAPFAQLAQQGMTLEQTLNQCCYSSKFVTNATSGATGCQLVLTGNPDFASWIPKVHNLVERIQLFKPHLMEMWHSNRQRLDQCYQLRAFEADMVIVFQWLEESRKIFLFTYNQVCDSSQSAITLQKNDEAFNQVATDAFKEIDRLVSLAGHLVSNNHYARQEITQEAHQLEREKKVFQNVLAERTKIVGLTVKFFSKAEEFINSVPGWTEAILGIDFTMTAPNELIDMKESLNHAFNTIKVFYNEVGQLAKVLLELLLQPPPVNEYGNGHSWAYDLNYSVCSDPVSAMKTRVLRDFQHLEMAYENKLQCISLFIAVEMFEKDVNAVVSWIDDHGEPFIRKTTNIGKSLTRTKGLVRKHDEFITIAKSTQKNAQKVVQTGNELLRLGVGDQSKISKYINLIQMKMNQFQEKVDYRTNLLQLAFKFYENMKNINTWIKLLKDKLSDNSVPESLEAVRSAKKSFETERNATIDAMLDCRNDGEKLREELRQMAIENDDPRKFTLPDVVNESMNSSEKSDSGIGSEKSSNDTRTKSKPGSGGAGVGAIDEAGYRAVTELIASLDDHRRELDELWSNRKFSLDLGEQLRWFEQRCREINDNATYWVAQLDEIRRHENANSVAQMLQNSSEAVNATVQNAKEVLKAGQELYLYVRNVTNIQFFDCNLMGISADEYVKKLWTDLKENVETLQESDNQQRHQFQLQIEVNNFEDECKEALDWIQTAEHQLNESPVKLTCLDDASKLEDETRHFHACLQKQHQSILGVYRRAEFILSSMEYMNSDSVSNGDDMYQDDFKGNIRINQLAKQIADDWGRLVSRVEYRNDLARTASNFFKTHSNLVDTLESLQRDFSMEEDTSPDMPVEALRSLLAKHSSCKEDFTKLCGFIRKLSEGFLAQLQRKVNHEPFKVDKRDDKASRTVVQQKMESVLISETSLLTAWDKRKKRLDNHLKVAELKNDCENILKWLKNNREIYINATTGIISGAQPLTGDQLRLVISQHESFRQQAKLQKQNIEELMCRFADLKSSQTPVTDLSTDRVPNSPSLVHPTMQMNELQKLCKKLYSTYKCFHKDTDAICAQSYRLLGTPPPWEKLVNLQLECPAPDTPVGTGNMSSGMSTPGSGTPGVETVGGQALQQVPSTPVIDNEKRRLERKREFVINELLETEKAYVKDLDLCVKHYLGSFRNAPNMPATLMDKKSIIFANIEQIYAFHSEIFLKELEGYRGRPEDVGHGFVRNAYKFKQLYVEYCKNMPESNRVILMPESCAFFETVKDSYKLSLEIQSCLIKPVQRITKYGLLLKDLLSCCDFQSEIKEALELMKSVPQKANDTMHLSLLQNVPKELNLDSQGDLILQDTFQMWEPRQLIKKGRERHLFLFEDFILLAKIVKDASGQKKYLYKAKFEVRSADFSITDHVDTERKFGLYFSRPYNDSNKYVLRAPTEEVKNDWLVALRSAKRPELYLEKNLDVGGSAAAAAASRRSVNMAAAGSNLSSAASAAGASRVSVGSTITTTSDISSPLASQNSLDTNRNSNLSRDSQASTGDEREPSMISNEYVELSPVLTSSATSQGTFNYSSPIASQHSNSHLYMNTAGTSQHNHSSSMDSNYSNYAIPNATQTPAHYHQLSSQSSTASAQPPPPTMKRQLSAGSNVPSHQTGVLEQLDKRVSVSSLSSSTGGIPSDREEPSQDSITMVDVTSTPVGHTGDNERTLCHSNEEHAIVAEGEERGDSGEGAYYSNIIPTSGSTAPQSGRSGSFSHDDGSDLLNVNGADGNGSNNVAKRSNSIKKWLTSPVRKLSNNTATSGSSGGSTTSNSANNLNSASAIPTLSGSGVGGGHKRSPLTAKLANSPQIQAMYSQHYSNRKSARSDSTENITVGLTGCTIQEGNEESSEYTSSSHHHPASHLANNNHQQSTTPYQQATQGESSANATLERDQGSLGQSQLPPPMPELSPSSGLSNLATSGPVDMRRNQKSDSTPFQGLSLDEMLANHPPREPRTKRECMVFEIADTEAKYVHSLGTIVECYMAATSSSSSSYSAASAATNTTTNYSQSASSATGDDVTTTTGAQFMNSSNNSNSLSSAFANSSNSSSSNINGGGISVVTPAELADRLHVVWGNIRQIYEWHRNTLLPALDNACYSDNIAELANCFIKHERRFMMYSKYALNLPMADYVLGEFDYFFSELRRTLGLKLGLKDLVVEPIQRAMRYQLMLQGLVAHLEKHPEQLTAEELAAGAPGPMDRLRHSLRVMTRIPKEVNDTMQLGKLFDYDEKNGKITAQGKLILQASLKFFSDGSPNLSSSSNKKKDAKKTNSGIGSAEGADLMLEPRHVFLFEQSMIVAEAEKGSGSSNFIGPRYFFKNFIKGSSMNGVILEGNNNNSNSTSATNGAAITNGASSIDSSSVTQFRLECSNDRNYDFQFDNSATCQLWANTITNLIMERRDFARALSKPIEFQKKQLLNSSNSSCNSNSTSSTNNPLNPTGGASSSGAQSPPPIMLTTTTNPTATSN
ncbi:triple functional domain protein-like isoform X2 [Convolutriloba macropyga]|uniref:triple functional domain protein-like isoform X2 n=1 Tax=Convolutriloba macropyga TaxID=536237 RepID=UPI003F51D06D